MASTSSPYGFRFNQYKGGKYNNSLTQYLITSGYNPAVAVAGLGNGDPVTFLANGVIGQMPIPIDDTAVGALGVLAQVQYTNSQNQYIDGTFWPSAATATGGYATASVADQVNNVYVVQTNATLGGPAAGKNFNFTYNGGASATTSTSNAQLNVSSGGGNQVWRTCKIVGILKEPDNNWTDNYTNVLVMFNKHAFKTGTLGTN